MNKFCVFTALYPSTGTEAAILPHSHGTYEATSVPSIDPEEVLFWSIGSARPPRRPATTQTDKEEGQGGTLLKMTIIPLIVLITL